MWYARIHAYLQLIRLKEGTASNAGNILRFAKRKHIKQPEKLMLEELQDGLQFCQIRKADLRKQAKELWKVHLRTRCSTKETIWASKGHKAKDQLKRKQKDVVPNKKDSQGSSQPQRT
jgi:hypothetical protein